jgi:hypothetical protein
VTVRIGFIWLRIISSNGLVNTAKNPPDSVKGREFLDQQSDYRLLKKDSAPFI